jgi:hypothetical protein
MRGKKTTQVIRKNIHHGHRTHPLHHQARRRGQERDRPDLRPLRGRWPEGGRCPHGHLSRGEAEQFYAVHKERPFFKDLVEFMMSGPVMIQALEGENAILKNRDLMGATDPKKAAPGTIRADFADSIDANAVHGSDAAETAARWKWPSSSRHERLLALSDRPHAVPCNAGGGQPWTRQP